MPKRADHDVLREPAASLAAQSSNAIVIFSAQQRVRWANLAFGELLGETKTDWSGQTTRALLRYLRHDAPARLALSAAVAAEGSARLRAGLPAGDSQTRWVDIDLQTQYNSHGAFDGHIAVLCDVT